jgi:hypothetical protein
MPTTGTGKGWGDGLLQKLYPYGCIKERTHWEPDILSYQVARDQEDF